MNNIHVLGTLSTMRNEDRIHDVFDFSLINGYEGSVVEYSKTTIPNCFTLGCLAGELPGIEPEFYFNEDGRLEHNDISDHYGLCDLLMKYFNLPESAISHIFFPGRQDVENYGGSYLSGICTFEEVQLNLRIFLTQYKEF